MSLVKCHCGSCSCHTRLDLATGNWLSEKRCTCQLPHAMPAICCLFATRRGDGFQSFGVLIMKLNVPLKAHTAGSHYATPPQSQPPAPGRHLQLVWHFWTRAANAACETINHEIENAEDDDDGDDDDLKSPSPSPSPMQSRQLSQIPSLLVPILTHVLRPFVPLL